MTLNSLRPNLTKLTPPDEFLSFYCLKKELYDFCSKYSLPTYGSKGEMTERIKNFLTSGEKINRETKLKKDKTRDSSNGITIKTKVINYKNDAITRKFFVEQIGDHFHFNFYLRQFSSGSFKNTGNLTYGDLVDGWIKIEEIKKDLNHKTEIGKQFEYNQFIRDFFQNEKGKKQKDAILAWNFIKKQRGKRNYHQYKKLKEIDF